MKHPYPSIYLWRKDPDQDRYTFDLRFYHAWVESNGNGLWQGHFEVNPGRDVLLGTSPWTTLEEAQTWALSNISPWRAWMLHQEIKWQVAGGYYHTQYEAGTAKISHESDGRWHAHVAVPSQEPKEAHFIMLDNAKNWSLVELAILSQPES